ncbi:MAG TPA: tRNA (adenosine(37)-N6)-threonylcarbamoyltransferase complex ATPase subunit type 1 TsaE [Candidatus Paceibacterota bacterium]|nr:tRNA (adenosine(37)-N6)-threonylcarbamoyltransferase complex ATPase subunit type 1 TsaE [Candidatus Paceibacterota bacterium]HMO82599.1 tRNA (adenosine(37)-N6)-threonylcarbamoyltransferase complex ATPase subunit type 1 TsaE [Candidatus Paceibacterota bacterium]
MPPRTEIKGLAELRTFAANLLRYLSENKKSPTVIALSGNLGAGKTTLVQQLALELGIKETVTSPTFTIMKSYEVAEPELFQKLIHMDAYRIDSLDELRPLGLKSMLKEPANLFCIEWAERIAAVLPGDTIYLTLNTIDVDTREIVFSLEPVV